MNAHNIGQIITFYSYKGGTGRTMALANIACLLGQKRPDTNSEQLSRVLALDWDFEAPGLHRYFRPYLTDTAEAGFDSIPGCLDLFSVFDRQRNEFHASDFIANRDRALKILQGIDFNSYLLSTRIPGLQIMKAGFFDDGYGRRVSEFQWDRLFRETIGLFSGFAEYLRQNYDYILMDSRTGLSDTSGICTMLLPDKLVVVFTPNQQSLTGICDLAHKALSYRKASPDGRPMTIFPLPSRIEMARPTLLEAWRMGNSKAETSLPPDMVGYQPLFEKLFDEIYAQTDTHLKEYFDAVMLQHIPDYAYGEPIAVMLEETDSRLSLRSSYAAFAEYLIELQAPWESIVEVRLEREIDKRSGEARAKISAGDTESALRIAYGLMERKPPPNLFKSVAEVILEVAQAAYPRERSAVSSLLSQAIKRVTTEPTLDPMQVADVLEEVGKVSLAAGDYTLAEIALKQGLQHMQEVLGEDAPAVLAAGDKLAEALRGTGALNLSRQLSEKLLASFQKILGEEDPETLASMNNLASTIRAQGDMINARILQEKVLDARRRVLGEEHPNTLVSMNNLANTLKDQGDLVGALMLQEKVLEVSRRVVGEEHPNTLTSMSNLALTLRDQGDLAGARALQEKALEICRRVLGEEHPDTLTSMSNLALTFWSQGNLADACTLQEKVLEISSRVQGKEHPDTLNNMSNLAETLSDQGDLAGARTLEEKVLEIRNRVQGEAHPDTLTSMNNLASTLWRQGDLAGARALQEKVLEIRNRVQGEAHPDTLVSMNNLAHTIWSQKDLAGAYVLQKKVMDISRRVLGEEHLTTLTSMNNLANTLNDQGDLAGARALQEKVLESCYQKLGKDHPNTLTSMNNLAETLRSQGDLVGAYTLQEQVLEGRSRVLGKEHMDTLSSMNNLAGILRDQGDLPGARALQEKALDGYRRVLGEKHPDTLNALSQLMQTAQKAGDMETVVALSQELTKSITK